MEICAFDECTWNIAYEYLRRRRYLILSNCQRSERQKIARLFYGRRIILTFPSHSVALRNVNEKNRESLSWNNCLYDGIVIYFSEYAHTFVREPRVWRFTMEETFGQTATSRRDITSYCPRHRHSRYRSPLSSSMKKVITLCYGYTSDYESYERLMISMSGASASII